jgi:hypothetical protein
MTSKSKISTARPGSTSVRTTLPEAIAQFLRVKEGDTLAWEMTDTPEGRIATVKKAKN